MVLQQNIDNFASYLLDEPDAAKVTLADFVPTDSKQPLLLTWGLQPGT